MEPTSKVIVLSVIPFVEPVLVFIHRPEQEFLSLLNFLEH